MLSKEVKSQKNEKSGKLSSTGKIEQEVLAIVNKIADARRRNDKDLYNSLVSEDYYTIAASGRATELGNKNTRNLNTAPILEQKSGRSNAG